MKRIPILSVIEAKNKDVIIRLAISASLKEAMPGQYVELSLLDDDKNPAAASIFVVNVASAYVDCYLHQAKAKRMNLNASASEIFISEVKGDSFVLPERLTKTLPRETIKPILIADEAGLPSILFLAEKIKTTCQLQSVVFLFSKNDFPFTPIPSQFVISHIPMGVLAACPMLEDKKIPSRLISESFLPGCYEGGVSDFFAEFGRDFFQSVPVEVFAAGIKETLDAVEVFTGNRHLPVQLKETVKY